MSTVQQIGQNAAYGSLSTGTLSTPGSLTTGSITFPTAGGTPTPLADYEEYSDASFTFDCANGYSPQSIVVTLSVVRAGRMVFAHFPAVTTFGQGGGTTSVISSLTPIPARFLPVNSRPFWVRLMNSGANSLSTGTVEVDGVAGTIVLRASVVGAGLFNTVSGAPAGTLLDTYLAWHLA